MSLEELLGTWRLDRTIEDWRAQERLGVTGTAALERIADGRVRWHEQGTLRGASRTPSSVSRTLYVVAPVGGQGPPWVTFEDGRPFHPWSPGVEVAHACAPDDYRGLVETRALPHRWTVRWSCHGPAKDYTMTTSYRPLPPA